MISKDTINKEFWKVICTHYEKECYTDCLKDACLYLIQLVQERVEDDAYDGEKLINNVFSEKTPKLLINNNQTQTEKDEQRGFGFILKGIICAIRNPISHKNSFKFSKGEVDSILLFMNNYILPKLDNTKDFGFIDDWFNFIFVENKNESERYVKTLLKNIKSKDKFNLMLEIIERLCEIETNKYKYFINELYKSLNKKQQAEIILALNKKLITVNGESTYLKKFLSHFDQSIWHELEELVQVKIEEIIYESIKNGKYYAHDNSCDTEGAIATFSDDWIEIFSNKDEIIKILFYKIKNEDSSGLYAIKYFLDVMQQKEHILKYESDIIKGLKSGNYNYKELLDNLFFFSDGTEEYLKPFEEEYNKLCNDDLF